MDWNSERYWNDKLKKLNKRTKVVGVNLGGTGEVKGYWNVNPSLDRAPETIPHPRKIAKAENVDKHFSKDSVDHVMAGNIVSGTINWATTAIAIYKILRKGGLVSLAEHGRGDTTGEEIVRALRKAHFRNIKNFKGAIVYAEK